jgi:hypothetical protein
MILSIKERVFRVEYVFREGNRYTDLDFLSVGSSKTRRVSWSPTHA